MKVFNLRCAHDHHFEGWFASDEERQNQLTQGLLTCPLCGNAEVVRLPSAPRIQVGKAAAPRSAGQDEGGSNAGLKMQQETAGATRTSAMASAATTTLQTVWLKAIQQVIAHTDDVGDQFADEARRIHYGEAEERGIRGKATPQEKEALRDEGIEVVSLPMPDALKGTLQ